MLNSLLWWRGIVITFVALWLAKWILPLPFMNEVLVFSIYTIGCNFLLGRVGFISFGQPAYLAVGAYATAFYLFYFGTNPYIGMLIGAQAFQETPKSHAPAVVLSLVPQAVLAELAFVQE